MPLILISSTSIRWTDCHSLHSPILFSSLLSFTTHIMQVSVIEAEGEEEEEEGEEEEEEEEVASNTAHESK